jgi:hypothetical protein
MEISRQKLLWVALVLVLAIEARNLAATTYQDVHYGTLKESAKSPPPPQRNFVRSPPPPPSPPPPRHRCPPCI